MDDLTIDVLVDIKLRDMLYNNRLSEIFLEKYHTYPNFDWNIITYRQFLSEEFIEKFQDNLSWYSISKYQYLSESFIEKYQDKVDWYCISLNQKLSEEFIEKYKDKVDWKRISNTQRLSESFIEKHCCYIDWRYILISQTLSKSFIKKLTYKVNGVYVEELYNKHHRQMTEKERIKDMKSYAKKYDLEFDGKYLYAYREHDMWGRGYYNKTIQYEVVKLS